MDFGQIAYGTSDPFGPYDPQTEGGDGALSQVGAFFGNILTTVSQQLPGMITGQPTATTYPATTYPTAPRPTSMLPLLLIGGVALYLLTSKRR